VDQNSARRPLLSSLLSDATQFSGRHSLSDRLITW